MIDHTPPQTPITSFSGEYRFLSNFYPCEIPLDGIVYPSVEHAYQAAKFPTPSRAFFVHCTAGYAKRLGREAILPPTWYRDKMIVMWRCLVQKFSHPHLRQSLLATNDRPLVEGNHWHDTFWGVCHGVGQNQLGLMLMAVRADIRQRTPPGTRS